MEEETGKVSLFGSLIGGTIGALVWALIGRLFGYEIGFIAWGVGIAVGICSVMFGGRGDTNGVVCALVTVAAIFAGKVLAVHWTVDAEAIGSQAVRAWSWSDSFDAAKRSLDVFDLGFAGLGIITALQLGRSSQQDVDEAEQQGGYTQAPAGE